MIDKRRTHQNNEKKKSKNFLYTTSCYNKGLLYNFSTEFFKILKYFVGTISQSFVK